MTNETESSDQQEFESAAIQFLRSFEIAFHYDWHYTTMTLGCSDRWDVSESEGRTLLQTGWDDDGNDVQNLSGLLNNYRKFVEILKSRGIEPTVSNPPDDDWIMGRSDWPRPWHDVE